MPLPVEIAGRLALPLIAAPMTGVSGPELVIAACRNGVIGSFPTHNASSTDDLDAWLGTMADALGREHAPVAPNLVVHPTNARLEGDLARLVAHGIELVITSVGSPKHVVAPLHAAGCRVYADVATLKQAQKAIEAGVDGLVLLSAGAGGQTGQANPFAFVRAVREVFDGTIVLAGGISDGISLFAAEVLGADLGYMGTRFIATSESLASAEYQKALVSSTMDDVRLSNEVGGLPASLLGDWLDKRTSGPVSAGDFQQDRLVADPSVWSAGHSVSGVRAITGVDALVAQVRQEYDGARSGVRSVLDRAS
ncbi:MAG TPA: nitronate monooxygenase [Nocardioidaceae bacterium]|nr:nitronate monooxygenase [Nocardioidaceae bacterium]